MVIKTKMQSNGFEIWGKFVSPGFRGTTVVQKFKTVTYLPVSLITPISYKNKKWMIFGWASQTIRTYPITRRVEIV